MPKKIGEQFTTQARERRYDFERMGVTLDGQVYLLEKGTDYHCSEPAIRGHLREYAKERGLVFASKVRRTGRKIEGVEVAIASSQHDLPNLDGSGANIGGVARAATSSTDAPAGDSGLRMASPEAA